MTNESSCLEQLLHLDSPTLPAELAQRPALHFEGEVIGYGSLYRKAWRAAAALHTQGIRPGDRVALWMTNRPELVECYLGCFLAGAVIMPVYNKMIEHELRPLLAHSSPALLISERQLLGTIESATPLAPAVWSVDGAASDVAHPSGGILDYQSLMEAARPELFSPPQLSDDAPASLMYTSGTTGEPKGAVHLRRNHTANIADEHALVRQDHSDEVLCSCSSATPSDSCVPCFRRCRRAAKWCCCGSSSRRPRSTRWRRIRSR